MKSKKELNEKLPVHKKGLYEKYVKRPLDFCCASLAIVVFSPVMFITALLVRMNLGSPVLSKQKRLGLNGQVFNMYKFRTITDEKDKNGNLFSDEERLTKFGKILRSTSLDELPELINILKRVRGIIETAEKSLIFKSSQG